MKLTEEQIREIADEQSCYDLDSEQVEFCLNFARAIEAAASAPVIADTAGAIRGPLTDHQRQNAIALYMNLPHSWESAIAVVSDASTSGYTNGVLDASPAIDAAGASGDDAPQASVAVVVKDLIECLMLWNGQAFAGLDMDALEGLRDELNSAIAKESGK